MSSLAVASRFSRAQAERARRPRVLRPVMALLVANLRYWRTVAPVVHGELTHWRRTAAGVPEPGLRRAALDKLGRERFNVEVAATLATLAPSRRRASVTSAIAALQIAYDYLDLVTESPDLDRGQARRMLSRLRESVDLDAGAAPAGSAYLDMLLAAAAGCLQALPGAAQVSPSARQALARCAEGQAMSHGAVDPAGEAELARWAQRQALASNLGWRELAAGASASVLCAHALLAAAASPSTTREQARGLDSLYLSIGALSMLDGLVDRAQDAGADRDVHLRRYRDAAAMAHELSAVATDALADLNAAPHAAHHAITLAGVVAYYASAPAASEPPASEAFARLQAELGWLLAAPLTVMRAWRLCKRIRNAAPPHLTDRTEAVSSIHLTDAHRSQSPCVHR